MLLARHETTELMEIFDERGQPVGKVTLPTDSRLFGSERGTVYLERRAPALPETPIRSAQAA